MQEYQEAIKVLGRLVSTIEAMPHPIYYSDVEARARRLEGNALTRLGLLQDAETALRRAVELRMTIDVPSSPWLALARLDLAGVLILRGSTGEVTTLLNQAQEALHELPAFERHLRPQLDLVRARVRQSTRRELQRPLADSLIPPYNPR